MINPFITAAKKLIYKNGIQITFVKVQEGDYDADTGSVTNTETQTTVIAYPEEVTANQYNFPNLIGKVVTKFSVVSVDLGYKPLANDKIIIGTDTYSVVTVKDIVARGESVIYLVNAIKG